LAENLDRKPANAIPGTISQCFWRREYFDRWMRTERELSEAITYVEANPVRRGLIADASDFRWSSRRSTK